MNTDVSSVTLLLSLRASQLLALPPFPSPVVFSKREGPTWEAAVTALAGGEVPSPRKSTASVWVCTLFADIECSSCGGQGFHFK